MLRVPKKKKKKKGTAAGYRYQIPGNGISSIEQYQILVVSLPFTSAIMTVLLNGTRYIWPFGLYITVSTTES